MLEGDISGTHFQLRKKIRVAASLEFDTAWRIGSGQEGETMSDLGVLLDPLGQPILPGSSLKGKLRSTCESLAHALDLTACLLNVGASNVSCTSDVRNFQNVHSQYQEVSRASLRARLQWIDENTCDVCKLFGSPVQKGRLGVSDGALKDWASVVQVRDSVVIDRDSQTAVDGLKYDYEVIPPGSCFGLCIDLENPTVQDLALLGAALFEWHAGSSIGGFTSRGLGRFHLCDIRLAGVDLDDPRQLVNFLTSINDSQRLEDLGDWEEFFATHIQQQVKDATELQEN